MGYAFDELYRQFDRIGGTHLVVFDEIDHLEDANTLLDELLHARANQTHFSFDGVRVVDAVVAALLRHFAVDLEEIETRLLRSLKQGRHRESAVE